MILAELNNKLDQLSRQPCRENVLEFAFALIDWMGLQPNKNGTPQLLSPKTQKLREHLENAPQTVQAQLYRLSADDQNIRIRFAVLKKVRKDYISQLVDNDPGSESFQKTPEVLKPVIKAPYFIHFVTTKDYDKLILIFNHGDQKRIVNFRTKLTNTQYNRIIQQWQGIAAKTKPEIADLLWKSLDVKEVNKEFYRQIKERFDALVGIAKTSGVKAAENQVRQFAIQLIGRYIFCWFLKEKGIIPPELLKSKTIWKISGYYQSTLLKLFFDTLNTKIQDRNPLVLEKWFERIPYLNGGLFDESEEDRLFKNIEVDDWLANFVEVLENYDFTVDESSSQYQQVAVDPEMLGRIFENLLASQNPETEQAANSERKSFGAFYTPREIVDYMVNESLKTFLAKKLKIEPDELSPAFSANPGWPEKLKKRKLEAETALQNIKILDPACGSGAFPMGVLHRLISLRELVSLQPNTYQLKKEILSNNIYGIDIMPMAVEIARLRAWLSLIVEEEYKHEKSSSNFGIDALPNLDFKFMQGNSLLETYEGIVLFDEKLLVTKSTNGKQELIDKTKNKIKILQKKYFDLHGAKKLKGLDKAILEKELKESNDLLNKILKVEEPKAEYGLFSGEENASSISDKLKKLHKEFFGTTDKDQKKQLKDEIETLEWHLITTSLSEMGKTDKLEMLKKLRDQNIKPYFLYKLNFPEVFTEKDGFDIVIGNPPYVRQEAIDPYYKPKYIEAHPEVGSGTADVYVYFFDSAINSANPGGTIIFITLNKYLKTKYGEGLRKKLKDKNVDMIIDFFELPVFEASTDTAITKIINEPDIDNTRYYPIKSLENLDLNIITRGEHLYAIKDETEWKFVGPQEYIIFHKLYKNTVSVKSFVNDKIFSGIKTAYNRAFIINDEIKNNIESEDNNSQNIIKKYANATYINKYSIEIDENKKWFINSHNGILLRKDDYKANTKKVGLIEYFVLNGVRVLVSSVERNGNRVRINRVKLNEQYPAIYKHLKKHKEELILREDQGEEWYNLRNCDYIYDFEKPKLIYIHTAKVHQFYYDEEGYYINNSCYMIVSDNKFLFFFLNSLLFDWFKRIKFVAYGDADEAGRVKLDYNKMVTVPIKQITDKQLKWFEKQYTAIKSVLSNAPKVKVLEQEAETQLFKIYELTYGEVKTVCPDFWLSETEYNNYKTA